MRALQGGTVLAAAMCLALGGCSTPTETEADEQSITTGPESSLIPPRDPAPVEVNIAGLADMAADFPPEFPVVGTPAPGKVEARWANLVGLVVGSGKRVSVDPPQCKALFAPVNAQGDADRMGVGAEGPDKQLLNISVYTPVTVPVAIPSAGCERMSFHVDDDAVLTQGTADRLAAPSIEGASTTAMRIQVEFWEFVEYHYVAILDGRTFVQVVARVHPGFSAEPLLPDLLVKGVAAIRGA